MIDILQNKLESYCIELGIPIHESSILVSFSGGMDSTVLVSLMVELKALHGFKLSTVHFNHQVHEKADKMENFCKSFANEYNIYLYSQNFIFDKLDNFEARAREKRYFALEMLANDKNCHFIFTAHHRDDQFETLLMKKIDQSDWISQIGIREKLVKVRRPLLDIDKDTILNELKSHFSFYWYHFINCQLKWLRMWKDKIKDVDLILITLQAIIPTLQYADKNQNIKDAGLENLYMIMDKTGDQYKFSNTSISATSVSEITGIPRATCIRKLEMLMKLGVLMQEAKTKRYYVNQLTLKKTNKILTKDNTLFTIENFSECSAIILNAITATKR